MFTFYKLRTVFLLLWGIVVLHSSVMAGDILLLPAINNPGARNQTVCARTAIATTTFSKTGASGTISDFTVSGALNGLVVTKNGSVGDYTGISFSGTPTASTTIIITPMGPGQTTGTVARTLQVNVKALPAKPTVTANKTTGCTYEQVTFTVTCASGFVRGSDMRDYASPYPIITTIGSIPSLTYKCTTDPAISPVCESAAVSLPITPKATPTGFCVTPASTTDMTTPIKTCGSEANIQYTLIYIPTGAAVKTIVGTGYPLNFGPQFFPGCYKIVAKNTKSGCTVEMDGQACYRTNSTRMGVDESDEASEWVNIGENPVKEVLTVKFNGAVGQKVNIVLSDIQGKIVTNKEVTITQPRHTEEINMQHSATGTYILNVQQNEKIKRFTILKAQ